MPEMVFLFDNPAYLESPNGLFGWLGWLGLLAVILSLQLRWSKYQRRWTRRQAGLFFILAISIPITSLLIPGLRLPDSGGLPPPQIPREPAGQTIMLLSALPWLLAGGSLGVAPAAALAAASGLFLALWGGHQPFLPLELALLGTLFGAAMQQRYRTPFFRALRHPLVASLLLSLVYPALFVLGSLFVAQGILANRLDYAITQVGAAALAVGVSLWIGGAIAEAVSRIARSSWGNLGELVPSPVESRLEARFLYGMVPLAVILLILLMVGDWVVAGSAARQMLKGRMENAAEMAAESIPFFLETGQNLILQLAADPRPYESEPAELRRMLAEDLRTVPYFNQFFYLDVEGEPVTGYPAEDLEQLALSQDELAGIEYALNGVKIQSYTVPPTGGSSSAQVSFLVSIQDEAERVQGVLIGRSEIASNPLAQPLLTSLKSMGQVDGEGMLLDENGRILFHTDADQVMSPYSGQTGREASFYDETAPDGTRQLVYYQPATGRSWAVVLTVPARYAQQQALNIATPLLGMILVLSLVAFVSARLGLRVLTASLHNLTVEANRMSQGELDHALRVDGVDEVGQLRRSFEQMRARLKARLDELNRLLVVSQGVASTLEIGTALQPILESALGTGASSARVVLVPAVVPDLEGDAQQSRGFGAGPTNDLYQHLDEQILYLARQQERVVLTNLTRPRLLVFSPGASRPQALMALALRHENLFFGVLWVAYDQPHQFSDEEVRYLVTLAGQAALAAANSRLFLTAEIGRQRLEAILASTPDPVLVTDHQNRLLLMNPATCQLLGWSLETGVGQPIEQILTEGKLVELLRSTSDTNQSAEIILPDGQVYLATASSVIAEGIRVGRVCVMRNVTHFKELDSLKSEFVSTVSHDLRSPLTLIRGYATMLQMVGELNEQQNGYVRKIVSGVESMSRLVNNLLDLGRIEAGVGLQLEMQPLQDVVERVISALQLQAAQKRINLTAETTAEHIPLIEADQALLQQALHNLVENAIKYTEQGGEVQVRLHLHQDQAVFEVRDTGIGIAPADQHRLFEKFFRGGRKGLQSERGSGLGLAIVKSIAERHNGRVWVESQLGKGSRFYLAIPLRQEAVKA